MTTVKIMEKAIENAGGRCEFGRKRQQYSDDLAFFEKNFTNWVEKHDNEWVAIYNEKVVGHSKAYSKLAKIITEQKKLPINEVVVKYLTTRKVATLF